MHRKQRLIVDTAIIMWIALVSSIMEGRLTIHIDRATVTVITVAITRDTGMDIMAITGQCRITISHILIGHTTIITTIPDPITMRRVLIIVGHAGHNLD